MKGLGYLFDRALSGLPIAQKAKLGWEPKTQLRDGLAKTIAYFDELLAQLPQFARRARVISST